ncbi:MAG: cobalamin B12-binding domain-containing protein [Pseudomonadota bacterium]
MAGLRQRYEDREYWEDAEDMLRDQRSVAETAPVVDPDPIEDSIGRLTHAIEVEIIPRLILARRALPQPQGLADAALGRNAPSAGDITEFTRLVLAHDVGVATAYVEALRGRGVALEAVFLDLLAPAARQLGDLWNDDLCDFTEVTVGVWRLHQVVREFSTGARPDARAGEQGRRALLVALPGEQHTFGLVLLAEFFRRASWDVWSGPVASSGEMLGLVGAEWFGVVGLSISCSGQLQGLAAEIHAIRRASRNRAVGVMVGGSVFIDHPELVALVGADATAVDGRQATAQADSLLALMASHG